MREVGAYLRANRKTVICHNFGFACISFASYGSGAWVPTFFVRTYGWDAGHVGVVYGSIVAVFGCLGIVFGGRLADRWARIRPRRSSAFEFHFDQETPTRWYTIRDRGGPQSR